MSDNFQECAVAFLDILGFKTIISDAEESPVGLQRLVDLRKVLDDHVDFDNSTVHPNVPPSMRPKYLFVSDSIIFSAPLKYDQYDGLDIVIVKCIQVAQKILQLGHLVRGGVSVGKVWHDDKNIFGSGYIDAYGMEGKAIHPKILLSKHASEIWRQPSRFAPKLCQRY